MEIAIVIVIGTSIGTFLLIVIFWTGLIEILKISWNILPAYFLFFLVNSLLDRNEYFLAIISGIIGFIAAFAWHNYIGTKGWWYMKYPGEADPVNKNHLQTSR